ncbi:plasmid mobilization relaxosome protein MobC [Paralysiella testudinis]|uniref:Plasmid mobilization relaxosome protein MobC n=1 Tax=Paralysiella testudinis TaxID=2809020 RepID=A0A892ZK38_9NEIS|nr:plasmid mobilization relaxosome protein MobC [Paralysiella testudinis]
MAEKRLGKASVSALAKSLLLEVLGDAATATTPLAPCPAGMADEELAKERTVIRLQTPEKQYLAAAAAQYGTSVNGLVRQIIQSYISKNPVLSAAEVDALYQSNYQLLRIGRNLNQIARQLNAMEAASITTAEIRQLADVIDRHTEHVGRLLLANRARFE